MCLILFAYQSHPEYPFILIANRDEFYRRPTQSAHEWPNHNGLIAGKDLQAGGTWMGIAQNGRFAAVTNYREVKDNTNNQTFFSRGNICTDYLTSDISADQHIQSLISQRTRYDGFNALVGDLASNNLHYYSNKLAATSTNNASTNITPTNNTTALSPGIYGMCNHLIDTPWPKLQRGKHALANAINKNAIDTDELFSLLQNSEQANDKELPNTGVSYELEKLLSSIFIQSEGYGTRSSTVILVSKQGEVTFIERSFTQNSAAVENEATFNFVLSAPSIQA